MKKYILTDIIEDEQCFLKKNIYWNHPILGKIPNFCAYILENKIDEFLMSYDEAKKISSLLKQEKNFDLYDFKPILFDKKYTISIKTINEINYNLQKNKK